MTKKEYSKITDVVKIFYLISYAITMSCFVHHLFLDSDTVKPGLFFALTAIVLMFVVWYMKDKIKEWPHKYYLINYNDGNVIIDLTEKFTSTGNAATGGLEELGYGLVREEEEKIDGCSFSKQVLQ